jgi:hypothetical protein
MNMELDKLVLDGLEASRQLYSIVLRKPFLTVKVQAAPKIAGSVKATGESPVLTIANESNHEMEIRQIWFMTSYNRRISSEALDAKLPVKLPVNERVTYTVPVEELKAALNKSIEDTITEVVVADQAGRENTSRFNKAAQAAFAK